MKDKVYFSDAREDGGVWLRIVPSSRLIPILQRVFPRRPWVQFRGRVYILRWPE